MSGIPQILDPPVPSFVAPHSRLAVNPLNNPSIHAARAAHYTEELRTAIAQARPRQAAEQAAHEEAQQAAELATYEQARQAAELAEEAERAVAYEAARKAAQQAAQKVAQIQVAIAAMAVAAKEQRIANDANNNNDTDRPFTPSSAEGLARRQAQGQETQDRQAAALAALSGAAGFPRPNPGGFRVTTITPPFSGPHTSNRNHNHGRLVNSEAIPTIERVGTVNNHHGGRARRPIVRQAPAGGMRWIGDRDGAPRRALRGLYLPVPVVSGRYRRDDWAARGSGLGRQWEAVHGRAVGELARKIG